MVLTRNGIIIGSSTYRRMKDREILPKTKYSFPPNPPSPILDMDFDIFKRKISRYRNLWRGLMTLGLGRKYSLEACIRSGLQPDLDISQIQENTLVDLFQNIKDMINEMLESNRGYIYYHEQKPMFFSPIKLHLTNYDVQEFDDFDIAIDTFFLLREPILSKEASQLSLQRDRLLRIAEQQRMLIKKLQDKVEKLKLRVSYLYEYYQQIQTILNTIRSAKDDRKLDWDAVRGLIPHIINNDKLGDISIESINNDGTIVLKVGPITITTYYRFTLEEIARRIFERIKKLEN